MQNLLIEHALGNKVKTRNSKEVPLQSQQDRKYPHKKVRQTNAPNGLSAHKIFEAFCGSTGT